MTSTGRGRRPGLLACFTGLVLAVGFGTAAVTTGLGPEILPDISGGSLTIWVRPSCDTQFAFQENPYACVSNVTATAQYSSGDPVEIHAAQSLNAFRVHDPMLDHARATIRIQADQGQWIREVWIPQDEYQDISIQLGDPATLDRVHGRMTGLSIVTGIGAAMAVALLAGAAVWLVTSGIAPARWTRNAAILWMLVAGLGALWSLFANALGLAPLALVAWFWWMQKKAGAWLAEAESRPASPAES